MSKLKMELYMLSLCERWRLEYEMEYRFHPTRMWRFDLAIPEKKIAIEYNGGVFMSKSGHSNVKGQSRDQEKMNEAQIMGWRVLVYNALNYANITDDLTRLLK